MNDNKRNNKASSVFNWSPLPARKTLEFTQKKSVERNNDKEQKGETFYPNCEFRIWLRSCEKEIVEPLEGKVTGMIPQWLKGSLIRNGPGTLKAGQDEFQHLFDSSALLHRFGIQNGTVTYQCRFLRSEIYKKIWAANRLVMTEFGTKAVPDPCQTIFQRVATLFSFKSHMSDNAMISIYPFGDAAYAFNEMPFIHKIDLETLDTTNRVDLSENVSIVNHTSHPHVMDDTSVFNVGLTLHASGPHYSVVHFPKKDDNKAADSSMFDKARIVASIRARWPLHPSYMHTFGITENYFIIVEQPLSVSLSSLVALKFQNEPLAGALRWYDNEYTQINVISRHTGMLIAQFNAETFFYLHIINQYEDNNYIVLDICAYKDPSMLDCMYYETMRNMQTNPDYAKMFRGRPIRFVLPLNCDYVASNINLVKLEDCKATAYYLANREILVKAEQLCDLGCETPRINYERCLGRSYRYFYAISSDVDAKNPGTLIKVDVKEKSCKTWQEDKCFPGEPIFVPSPDSKFEDDGIILSVMVWADDDTNHVGLLIIDALNFEEIGRAEFRTPSPVPKCLHGWFFPKK